MQAAATRYKTHEECSHEWEKFKEFVITDIGMSITVRWVGLPCARARASYDRAHMHDRFFVSVVLHLLHALRLIYIYINSIPKEGCYMGVERQLRDI